MTEAFHTDELVMLGALAGAQVMVVLLSVINASAYRERALLVLGAAAAMCVLTLQTLVGGRVEWASVAMLVVLALAGLQLRELVSHAGALRWPRRWLIGVCAGLLPLLAIAEPLSNWSLLSAGVAAWTVVVAVITLRALPQSKPWMATTVMPALLALLAASSWQAVRALYGQTAPVLPLAALLTVWSAATYLATVWRNRRFAETRVRVDARKTVDSLTGLSTQLVLADRIDVARTLMRRYGHPSVLMLVHIENLPKITGEFGPEAAEAALQSAAQRVRQLLGESDVAARLPHARIVILAEGVSPAEAASNLASRILVAGLKEPLAAAPAEFLHFRVVMSAIPLDDVPARVLLHRLTERMDDEMLAPSERRIVTLGAEPAQA